VEDAAVNLGGSEEEGESIGFVEHFPAQKPLQGWCWVFKLGVWLNGRAIGQINHR
jgi:hypothetical protein